MPRHPPPLHPTPAPLHHHLQRPWVHPEPPRPQPLRHGAAPLRETAPLSAAAAAANVPHPAPLPLSYVHLSACPQMPQRQYPHQQSPLATWGIVAVTPPRPHPHPLSLQLRRRRPWGFWCHQVPYQTPLRGTFALAMLLQRQWPPLRHPPSAPEYPSPPGLSCSAARRCGMAPQWQCREARWHRE